jgi:ectoine hydroxylase-related dioxygenase (phytanoyl-CoA dioxygenase family)
MARGSPRLLTCWIPMEPAATLELGALALYRGSHAAPGGLQRLRDTYGRLDTEAEPGYEGSGWYTEDPHDVARLDTEGAGGWVSGDFAAGDVVIFGMHTLHMSTANLTNNVRVSCDVRWQPACDPIDERYTGSAEELREKQAQRKKGGAWVAAGASAGADALQRCT